MNFKGILISVWIWVTALATSYHAHNDPVLVCDSPECNQRAELLNESLNTSIDRCKEFYSYVCGRWESKHHLRSSRGSYDVYEEICEVIPQKLRYILGNRTLDESNQTILDKISIMYNACLALPDTRDALITVLNESGYNDWPIVTDRNTFNSSNCTDLLRHMNISAILHVQLTNMKQYANNPAYPYQMTIGVMPVQVEIKKMKVADIREVINNTMKFLNPGIDISVLENLTNELVQFAKDMSDITSESYPLSSCTISSLEAKFPNIPISDLLKKELRMVNITLNATDMFKVSFTYCEKLSKFLDTAKPNTLYNYGGFLATFPYIQYVNMSTEEAISNELTQSTTQVRNSSECITLLDKNARDILDYLYVIHEPNHTEIKNAVDDIARRLKQTFNETLQNASWIDNTTREALAKKLTEVPLEIGYPEALLNMSVLETSYQYVPFFHSNISFTEALYHIQENLHKMKLRKFQYPEEGDMGWDRSPRDCRGSFHDKFGTKIEIPYGLFVPPFFQQGVPRSLNYGGIGSTIARELAYIFSINAISNCRPRECQLPNKEKLLELFGDRTSCFKQQYKAVNEKLFMEWSSEDWFWRQTLDEDLADNTGLLMAFNAYYKILEEECEGIDTRLPGLGSFSGTQLFFISSAMTMCKIADKYALMEDIGRGYSYAQNRVNEAVKNFQEFAKAFNCSLDSTMHPNETCSFW